jgi:branched-chain amino acid transport system ATP-binding protein
MNDLLKINGLTKNFGGLAAVSNVDMFINEGEILGLIGPNGAGKTTMINLISGFLRPTSGEIIFMGKDISGKKPYHIAKLGIGRTFQIVPFFGEFTTLENIVASYYLSANSNPVNAIFNTAAYRKKEKDILSQAEQELHYLGLEKVRNELAKNLPHGYQRMLGLARAMAVKPKLLLLDEPLGGMNSDEIKHALETINKVRMSGVTILIIEHNMIILGICDRVVVISYGKKIAEGSPKEVKQNQEVIRAYLGGGYAT